MNTDEKNQRLSLLLINVLFLADALEKMPTYEFNRLLNIGNNMKTPKIPISTIFNGPFCCWFIK